MLCEVLLCFWGRMRQCFRCSFDTPQSFIFRWHCEFRETSNVWSGNDNCNYVTKDKDHLLTQLTFARRHASRASIENHPFDISVIIFLVGAETLNDDTIKIWVIWLSIGRNGAAVVQRTPASADGVANEWSLKTRHWQNNNHTVSFIFIYEYHLMIGRAFTGLPVNPTTTEQ